MKHMEAFRNGNSQREFHQSFRSQSAMEYLMTYGWAILIIAVVLAALFELGVFNPMTFAPKASPGSCQVVRPEGPGTTAFISLAGECNGEIPQYVAQFNGQTGQYIAGDVPLDIPNTNPITVTAWIYYKGNTGNWEGIFGINWGCPFEHLAVLSNYLYLDDCGNDGGNFASFPVPKNTWVFVAYTLSGTNLIMHENSNNQSFTLSGTYQITPNAFDIGTEGVNLNRHSFNGSIANIQVYDTALSSNDIKALYQEGIGGAPIKIQNLVGWWPLNGNANDYSGNGNNGVPNGVTYTSNWYSGYSAP